MLQTVTFIFLFQLAHHSLGTKEVMFDSSCIIDIMQIFPCQHCVDHSIQKASATNANICSGKDYQIIV